MSASSLRQFLRVTEGPSSRCCPSLNIFVFLSRFAVFSLIENMKIRLEMLDSKPRSATLTSDVASSGESHLITDHLRAQTDIIVEPILSAGLLESFRLRIHCRHNAHSWTTQVWKTANNGVRAANNGRNETSNSTAGFVHASPDCPPRHGPPLSITAVHDN